MQLLIWIEAFDFQTETYLKHIKETLNAPTGSKLCSEKFNSLYKFTIIGKHCVIFIRWTFWAFGCALFSWFLYTYRSKKYNTEKRKLKDLRSIYSTDPKMSHNISYFFTDFTGLTSIQELLNTIVIPTPN